jgi:hypothetical protein
MRNSLLLALACTCFLNACGIGSPGSHSSTLFIKWDPHGNAVGDQSSIHIPVAGYSAIFRLLESGSPVNASAVVQSSSDCHNSVFADPGTSAPEQVLRAGSKGICTVHISAPDGASLDITAYSEL